MSTITSTDGSTDSTDLAGFSTCPPPPQVDHETKMQDAAGVIQAMGIQACNTSNYNASASASISTLIGSGAATFQVNHTATVGCENLNVIADNYKNTQNNITCILNQSKSIMKSTTAALNQIQISASGEGSQLTINCPQQLQFKQGINVTSITQFTASDQDTAAISSEVKSLAQSTANILNKDASGLGADTHGSKNISQMLQNIQQANLSEQIKQAIKDVSISTNGTNMIKIESSGKNSKVFIGGSNCVINQDIVLNLVSTMIMNNVMSSTFSDVIDAINKRDLEVQNLDERKGVGNTFDSMYEYLQANQKALVILGGIIAVCVLIFFLFSGFGKKNKKGDDNDGNDDNDGDKGDDD